MYIAFNGAMLVQTHFKDICENSLVLEGNSKEFLETCTERTEIN